MWIHNVSLFSFAENILNHHGMFYAVKKQMRFLCAVAHFFRAHDQQRQRAPGSFENERLKIEVSIGKAVFGGYYCHS